MKRRVVALVAALLLAGVGTFVLVGFVRNAEDRATAGEERAQVYIVQRAIPRGTSGAELLSSQPPYVAVDSIPVKAVAAGAVTDLSTLAGFVADVDLAPGEQLIPGRWVPPEAVNTARDALPPRRVEVPEGLLELPISLPAEQALGGIIAAGDTVAVVASFDNYASGGNSVLVGDDVVAIPDSAADEPAGQATHILLHDVLVVEVQATAVPAFTTGEADSGTRLAPTSDFIVTFALTPRDVERMVFAAQYGQLWLASQTPDDDGPTAVVTIDDIFEG